MRPVDRKFNPILDDQPKEAVVGDRVYRLNTDFRVVLSFFRLEGEESEKTILTLRLFFGDRIYREDVPELLRFLGWYISKGEERTEDKKPRAKVFDFTVDAGRIFAAFFQVYGLNLRSGKDSLHWWTFCELLEALPEGTHLSEVVKIRSRKIDPGMSAQERNDLQRAKDRYRIGEAVDPLAGIFNSLKGASK